MEFKRVINHRIEIAASANGGYVVNVGCCALVYTEPEQLIRDLGNFLRDPKGLEREYYNMGCDQDGPVEVRRNQPTTPGALNSR